MGSDEWTWNPAEMHPTVGKVFRAQGFLILSQWHILIGLFGYVCPAGEHQSCIAIQDDLRKAVWKNNALP